MLSLRSSETHAHVEIPLLYLVFLIFGFSNSIMKIDRLTRGAKPHETHAIGAILVASAIRQGTLT